ncbi:hypothetical protein A3E17_03450 [Candidatus Amesbacteria bacterium RIFCSPHIGHO2_12_FULL_48_14]|uniref:Uncharacterized protein n=1 Tax=Candidatus Amesbacteria bacterium RIFCSPHIGHO2_12_FULL_48_14 TaxID=1797257 RepID=A0A1F4Z7H7_9BACT|nr:MAG: hypothetical protein A3E17_03450 [Candidatus Amesbacteria bacterium RIFCSPHIGHO2_12_FULL_48_14]
MSNYIPSFFPVNPPEYLFTFPLTLYKRPDGSIEAQIINTASRIQIEMELDWRDHLPKKAGGRVG